MNRIRLGSWLGRPAWGLREVGRGDIVLAGALSLFMVGIISGKLTAQHPPGGVVAALGALAMTLPVAWERRAPATAAAAVAIGATVNELLIGPMVRCGAALPAVFAIAFFVGTRCSGRRLAVGIAFCLGAVTTQAFFDPQLGPAFLVAGSVLPGPGQSLDLDSFLRDRIIAIAAAAAAGREKVFSDPAAADGAFAAVETSGRATLSQMREVVGTLRQESLTEPQPVLAQLGNLLERATSADARLQVEGSPRALPDGVELSGYRIVEHLLMALEDAPEARIDVRVRFAPDALELQVTGPAARDGDPATALALVRERAALLGGTLRVENQAGRCDVLVQLPLTPRYA